MSVREALSCRCLCETEQVLEVCCRHRRVLACTPPMPNLSCMQAAALTLRDLPLCPLIITSTLLQALPATSTGNASASSWQLSALLSLCLPAQCDHSDGGAQGQDPLVAQGPPGAVPPHQGPAGQRAQPHAVCRRLCGQGAVVHRAGPRGRR